ncbi:MAG TPA: lipoate--protein ligase family protein [Nitrospiria bacterium]|nr:lipoate--protein ligase family protein [Nitrospiria bacterium]
MTNKTRQEWRLLETPPLDPFMNMAVDEAISQGVRRRESPPTFRFYGWSSPSISIGYFQQLLATIDQPRCNELNVLPVRRLTGGGAVLHHREITYSVVAGSHLNGFRSIHETYLTLSEGLVRGLRRLGIPAEISPGGPERHRRDSYCFDRPARHEIVVQGRKLIGSAQRRWREAFLQHGSILLSLDERYLSCIRGAVSSAGSIGLEELLGPGGAYMDNIKTSLAEEIGNVLFARWTPGKLTEQEESSIGPLIDKYRRWTAKI